MEIEIGRGKRGRRAYGLDEIAIVPSRRTRDPEDVDLSWRLDGHTFDLPILASAMDGVVDTRTAGIIGQIADRLFVERAVERDLAHTIENFGALVEAPVREPVTV